MKRSSLKLFKNHIWFKIAKSYIPGKLGVEVSKHVPWQAGGGSFKACSQASWGWKFQSMFPGKLGVEVSRGKEYINKARNLPIEKDCHMLKNHG